MSSVLKVDAIQNTAGTSALTIDSSGAILKPVLPYGQASGPSSVTAATNKIELSANVVSGGGLTVDQTNERMIVPVAGLYAIGFVHLVNNTAAQTEVNMRKNGSLILGTSTQSDANSQYGGLAVHHIIELAASDYIEWWVTAGAVHNNTNYSNMYTYLLG